MEKILDRVKKLLALANDKGATEHEAALALEKAYALLAEHNLTMDAVQGAGGHVAKESRSEQSTATNWSESYYIDVWNYVADLNACFFWHYRPNKHKRNTKMYVFGRESNVILTTTMAQYLCETMRRLARQAAKDAGRTDFAFQNTYLHGMSDRLCTRIWELKEEAKEGRAKGSAKRNRPTKTRSAVANRNGLRTIWRAVAGIDAATRTATRSRFTGQVDKGEEQKKLK